MKLTALAACILSTTSCVSLPTPQEMLDTGFRTPEMTFHTFQMGVRADLPRLEYRCLSAGLQGQSGGQLVYREFREKELKGRIEYWLGIPDAKVTGSDSVYPNHHVLRAESHGYEFEVEFVREFFWQVWEGGEPVVDEALTMQEMAAALELFDDQGQLVISAAAELPDYMVQDRSMRELGGAFTEFRIGSEWKISGFREAAPPAREKAAPAATSSTEKPVSP